jgi:lysophospholipase
MSSSLVAFDLLPHSFFTLKDGARLRYAQFSPSPAPRGTVLIVPGAREFIEKKYIECGKRLMERGFCTIFYEPRGQGLSSRFLDGDFRQRGHIHDFSPHIDDLRAFYDSIVLPGLAKPLIVHGHSLGAHILLRWLAEDRPVKVAGAFVTSPMIAVSGMAAHMAGYGLSWMSMHLFGHETGYAPMQHDFGGDDLVFANNPLAI